jgi:hypothetical protein
LYNDAASTKFKVKYSSNWFTWSRKYNEVDTPAWKTTGNDSRDLPIIYDLAKQGRSL